MAARSEEEIENHEGYFGDVEVLNVSFNEMEIDLYFIWRIFRSLMRTYEANM